MLRARSCRQHVLLSLLVIALMVGNVHGWATLKKILMARLLSGPRLIAVPIPVPSGHHPPPRPLPHYHHHHHPLPAPPPPPPPPPPVLPVAVPIHHYHYPPTNVWDTPPIPKSPGVTEVTDLSHLHALFDAPADPPAKVTQEHAGGVDVVDYSAAAEALSSASADKSSKASSTHSLPTYSERMSTKRPSYNPYRSSTYYGAETPNRYYASSASSPYASKSYAAIDYDSYASKLLSKATRQPYGPRYLDEADFPANMAALRQFMKDHHIKSLEPTWNRQQTSYSQTESSSKWPEVVAAATKAAAEYPASSLYKGYGWTAYPTHSYNKAPYPTHSYDTSYPTHSYEKSYPMSSYDKSYSMPSYDKSYPTQFYNKTYHTHAYDKAYPTHSYGKKDEDKSGSTKQPESTDPFDWAQYVASAYKAAAEKPSSQSSAADRYDTVSQIADSDAETTTTESSTVSPKYQGNTKQGSPSSLASGTSTTFKTPTKLQVPDPPSVTTLSSGSPRSSVKV